jgi:uncharacterized protein (TIGR03437 family)
LGGTQVRINGELVPVLFSSPTRVRFLCPALSPDVPLSLVVETNTGDTEPITGRMQEATPKILSIDGTDSGPGLIFFAGTAEIAMQRNYRFAAHPAQAGDQVVLWVTGLGSSQRVPGTIQIRIGDVPAEIESIEPVPDHVGINAISTQIPAGAGVGDMVPVQIEIMSSEGRLLTSNSVTTVIELAKP